MPYKIRECPKRVRLCASKNSLMLKNALKNFKNILKFNKKNKFELKTYKKKH